MTTLNKLEQAMASAKGLSSDLKTFSLDTNDQQAKQLFSQLSTQMENITQTLQSRLNYVKSEEPQYDQEASGSQQQQTTQQNNKQNNM